MSADSKDANKQLIEAIRLAVKRLEEFAPIVLESYRNVFKESHATSARGKQEAIEATYEPSSKQSKRADEAAEKASTATELTNLSEVEKRLTKTRKKQRKRTKTGIKRDKELLEGQEILRRVNLVTLACFIAKLAGKEGALKLLTTYKGMNFLSKKLYDQLTTLIRAMPDYVSPIQLDDFWGDVILAFIDIYENNPSYWGFILLVRLLEMLDEGGRAIELK